MSWSAAWRSHAILTAETAHLLRLARLADGEDLLCGVAALVAGLLHVGLQRVLRVLDAAGVEDVEAFVVRCCLQTTDCESAFRAST